MAATAAVIFLAERVRPKRSASLTGLADAAGASAGACAAAKAGMTSSSEKVQKDFIGTLHELKWKPAKGMVRREHGSGKGKKGQRKTGAKCPGWHGETCRTFM